MFEALPFVVIIALVLFIATMALGPGPAEKPPLYWPLVFVTGCCAILAFSVSV